MKQYLGDGVYAEIEDSGMVKLTTPNGMYDTNTIYLEPEVAEHTVRYLKRYLDGLKNKQVQADSGND